MYIYCNCETRNYEIPLTSPPSEYELIKSMKLFIALAARTDNENGGLNEHWLYNSVSGNSFTKGKIYIQRNKDVTYNESFKDNFDRVNGFSLENKEKFRKATFDEIVAHYNGTHKPMPKTMTPKYTGDLKGFPNKVLLFLEKQQKAAGNRVDLSVFDRDIFSNDFTGGFNWKNIGNSLVTYILINKEFDRLDDEGNIREQQKPFVILSSIEDIKLIKDIPQHHEEPVKLISSFKPLNISSDEKF